MGNGRERDRGSDLWIGVGFMGLAILLFCAGVYTGEVREKSKAADKEAQATAEWESQMKEMEDELFEATERMDSLEKQMESLEQGLDSMREEEAADGSGTSTDGQDTGVEGAAESIPGDERADGQTAGDASS